MTTLSPSSSPGTNRAGSALPVAVILALAVFGALVAAVSIFSVQARVGAPGYSAAVLFNQANAYAHDGKTGLAVATYERARLLAPGDPNIVANLQTVREQAGLPDEHLGWLDRAVSWASPNLLAELGCLGLIFVGTGLLAVRSHGRMRTLFYLEVAAGIVLLALAGLGAVSTWQKANEAVVVAREASARISPAANGEVASKFREGETLAVHGRYQDFLLVEDASGNSGWVAQAEVMPVIPRS
jgi:hypothetical protein